MPDPNNPLSYIGASNDPSLTQRTVDTNRSLQEMRRNLGQIASQGINTLAQQRSADQAALERVKETGGQTRQSESLRRGIDLLGAYPNAAGKLEQDRTTQLADIAARAVANQATGGIFAAGPPEGEVWSQARIADPASPGLLGTPLALLSNPGYSKMTADKSVKVVTEEMIGPGGVGWGMLTPTQTTTESSIQGVEKGTDKAILEALMNMVFADVAAGKLGKAGVEPQIQAGSVVSSQDAAGNPVLLITMDIGDPGGMQQYSVPLSDIMPNE